jgi:hypothetical protein
MTNGDPGPMVGEREWLVKADYDASRDFDKAIMTLAAGALGLSIAFVHDLAPHPQAVPMLAVAWLMFAGSLLAILLSFLFSQSALRREITAIDQSTVLATPGGTPGKVTFCLNISGAAFLILGVVSLVVFAMINV